MSDHYGQHPVCDLCDANSSADGKRALDRTRERSRRAGIARKRAIAQGFPVAQQSDRIACYAADLDRPWFEPGDRVECRDASDGCWFLEVGKVFTVESIQFDSDGRLRLNLVGMFRAWEADRFVKA